MDTIIILDFGGQYCHLISRRIRDFGVYAKVLPSSIKHEDLKNIPNLKGIILSGGAASVYDKNSPKIEKESLNIKVPILGICYGHQLIAFLENGEVESGKSGEYGITELQISDSNNLLSGLNEIERVWMNHKDIVKALPAPYKIVASTSNSPIAVFENNKNQIYGVQFHPEVTHTKNGSKILENFVFKICGAKKEWNISDVIKNITPSPKSVTQSYLKGKNLFKEFPNLIKINPCNSYTIIRRKTSQIIIPSKSLI